MQVYIVRYWDGNEMKLCEAAACATPELAEAHAKEISAFFPLVDVKEMEIFAEPPRVRRVYVILQDVDITADTHDMDGEWIVRWAHDEEPQGWCDAGRGEFSFAGWSPLNGGRRAHVLAFHPEQKAAEQEFLRMIEMARTSCLTR